MNVLVVVNVVNVTGRFGAVFDRNHEHDHAHELLSYPGVIERLQLQRVTMQLYGYEGEA